MHNQPKPTAQPVTYFWWGALHEELHWLDVPRPGDLQAGSDSSPVSEGPRTTVSVELLRPSRRC